MATETESREASAEDVEAMAVQVDEGKGEGTGGEIYAKTTEVMKEKGYDPNDFNLRRRIGAAYRELERD